MFGIGLDKEIFEFVRKMMKQIFPILDGESYSNETDS